MTRPLHIGIVGCSAEGAALCYRTICAEGAALLGPRAHPEVSLHTASFADYVRCLDASDIQGVADLMLSSAHKLAAAGADFLICPDNTIHQAFPLVAPASPLPWLHIAAAVEAEARRRKYRKVGLIGTQAAMEGPVYQPVLEKAGIEVVLPPVSDRIELDNIIRAELIRGRFLPGSRAYVRRVISTMAANGVEAVILGCTELPLLLSEEPPALPLLDSTRLLAAAALTTSHLVSLSY